MQIQPQRGISSHQSEYPSARKLQTINAEAIKRNEIELFVMRWIDLESVIHSEVSQKERDKYRMLTHIPGI